MEDVEMNYFLEGLSYEWILDWKHLTTKNSL